ncbi:hypothetical protein [Enterobacter sp. GM-22]
MREIWQKVPIGTPVEIEQ